MNKESSQNALAIFLLMANLISSGCNSSTTLPSTSTVESMPQAQKARTSAPPQILDPTENRSKALREAWRRFSANGQYRLAQEQDMRFPGMNYIYIWADLAYGKRAEDDHLAAIIVDTTRNDENRFSLVIFSPPEGRQDYEVHWLYRDRDLSKTFMSQSSGTFFVREHLDDGSEQNCIVHWYRSRQQFQCRQHRVVSWRGANTGMLRASAA